MTTRTLPGTPGCCWEATAPETAYPTLTGERPADVAVVGAGIVGLTAALRLAEAGASVAVVEALRVGRQVTGRSTAKVTTQHALIYRHLVDTFGRDKAQAYADANRLGADRIAGWIADYGIDCDYEARDAYAFIGPDRDRLEDLDREAEAAIDLGLPADVVDRAPLPFATGGAVRFSDQAQFNPVRYLAGLADAAAAAGALVFEGSRVTAVEAEDGGWRVATDGGTVRAPQVLLASHLPIAGPDYSHRTQPHCHPAMAFRVAAAAAPDGMFIGVEDPTHSIRTGRDADGLLLVVLGPRFRTGQVGDVAQRFVELERWTRERFDVGEAAWRWVNEDYDTADRLPYVGVPEGCEGLAVATGLNAWGITNGSFAGLAVADRFLGREVPGAELFEPDRPVPDGFHKGGGSQSEVAGLDAIAAGAGGVISHGDEKLAVWKDDAGTSHALSASCTHMGCPVTWNNADRTWDCPCHGSVFAADGGVIHGPAVMPLEPRDMPG